MNDDIEVERVDLDAYRRIGDPLADAAVAEYFATVEYTSPGALFGHLVRHTTLPPEERVPAITTFLEEAATPPSWADPDVVARGQAFFNRLVTHHFSSLYFSSLPSSYAAAQGVQVLRMTSRLQTDTERRLNETAQFLMDIAVPGALDVGGAGVDRILHVRLMHAAVRWLIANDPMVTRVASLAPPLDDRDEPVWADSWGLPVNQEDLAGTWLTFTVVVYDAFDASGVVFDGRDVADHLHMWRLVGHHLGVDPALVARRRETGAALRDRIWSRQQAPSGAGKAMTAALVEQAHRHVPRPAWSLMPTAFRHFLGDDVADMLGLDPANWTRHLFTPLDRITETLTRGKDVEGRRARMSAAFGRRLMDGLLAEMRHGDRPGFQIPAALGVTR